MKLYLGILVMILGLLWQFKPLWFKRWFWKEKSFAQRLFTLEGYVVYMRWLGLACIIVGIVIIILP
ncbi:MAG: hypothetical protein ABI947_00900 [Chloroflexota bacterium]